MQVQMKFQKITAAFALVNAVLFFIFSLGFSTNFYGLSYYTNPNSRRYVEGSQIYYDIQGFNHMALRLSLVAIVLVAIMYIMQNTKRRKYYATNYISSVVYSGFIAWLAIYVITNVTKYQIQLYTTVDFARWKELDSKIPNPLYTESPFWFQAGTFISVLGIISSVAIIGNLIWKTIWMVQEKKALEYFGIGEETL